MRIVIQSGEEYINIEGDRLLEGQNGFLLSFYKQLNYIGNGIKKQSVFFIEHIITSEKRATQSK